MYYIHGCVILIALEQLFDIQWESESSRRQNLKTQKHYFIESLLKRRKLNHVQNHNIGILTGQTSLRICKCINSTDFKLPITWNVLIKQIYFQGKTLIPCANHTKPKIKYKAM